MSLLGEIKRRKIFQVAAVYAVVAWLLVQVVVAVQEPLLLPGWTARFVIVCLVIGFPVTLVMSWAFNLTPQGFVRDEGRAAAPQSSGKTIELALIGVLTLAVVFMLVDDYLLEGPAASDAAARAAPAASTDESTSRGAQATRFEITPPAGVTVGNAVAISPDGRDVVFEGVDERGNQRLYHRALVDLAARPLVGTDGAAWPFFSADGRWVAFVAEGRLNRVALEDATLVPVTAVPPLVPPLRGGGIMGLWSANDTLVLPARSGLSRVPASGGEVQTLELESAGDDAHVYLPGDVVPGGGVLATRFPWPPANLGQAPTAVTLASLETGEVDVLARGGASMPRYVPGGRLVFRRENALWAARFDPASGRLTSEAVPVVSNVREAFNGFDVADDGSLVFVSGEEDARRELVWVGRDGREEPVAGPPRAYRLARVSPDGDRIAAIIGRHIWIHAGTLQPLTSAAGQNREFVWSPDGQRIAYYASGREGGPGIFVRRADGTGDVERITSGRLHFPQSWSPDARYVVFTDLSGADVYLVDLENDAAVRPLAAAPDVLEYEAAISPNGRWLAFESDRAGVSDVWVQAFPNAERQYRVSTAGSASPVWARDGSTLFFLTRSAESAESNGSNGSTGSDSELMSVAITDGAPDTWGAPQAVMPWPYGDPGGATTYDAAPDGRFLAVKPAADAAVATTRRIVFVQRWAEELAEP